MDTIDVDQLRPLPPVFFARDTALVARELLGKVLVSRIGDGVCGGRIVEAEGYLGADDPGSHAATRGITSRNRVMYGAPAHIYVYFTYGNHNMLNLVTETEGVAGAVLVRAIEPLVGVELMRLRRPARSDVELCSGPGKLTAALGVDLRINAAALGGELAVCDAPAPREPIATSGRVGLSAGGDLPLRFYLAGNGYVSKGRAGLRS